MGFSFTATAKCDACGQLLGSSTEECDHDGASVNIHVFRKLGEGRESLVGVEATATYKWYALAEDVGEDWIAYQYIGTKGHTNSMLDGVSYSSVEELPHISMSCDAPADVEDEIFDEE
jgi:uncharacterized protein YfiM (DUF2279 family)